MEYIYKEVLQLPNKQMTDSVYSKNHIIGEYQKAIKKTGLHVAVSAEELYGTMLQLSQIAYSTLISRSYNLRYNLTNCPDTFESVASHSFLIESMMDSALSFLYGPNFTQTTDGFTYREIMQAIRRHDLPEIYTADIPDNGDRNDQALAKTEDLYWRQYSHDSPSRECKTDQNVKYLLEDSRSNFSTTTGRQIHAADKASAIFAALCFEEKGFTPWMVEDDTLASAREASIMKKCSRGKFDHLTVVWLLEARYQRYASEMWTIDFFDREFHKMDYGHYFTALIIMKTIAVTGKWYDYIP